MTKKLHMNSEDGILVDFILTADGKLKVVSYYEDRETAHHVGTVVFSKKETDAIRQLLGGV
jgi:S-adenosylmethionine synthetase